jgi:sugar O-acyltransferase (sialic acid O-acetyltransferase NeuD family)
MIIAGAGGHALEVLDSLRRSLASNLTAYGEKISPNWPAEVPAFDCWDEVMNLLKLDPSFVLGVGTPDFRKSLYEKFTQSGGVFKVLSGINSVISPSAVSHTADILTNIFIGAQVQLGLGVLINVGAQIHHEVKVGDFSVINPGAILLGGCEVGSGCLIGSQATILPGVRVGDGAVVGAGAVIIRDVPFGATVVGVPGRIIFSE